MMSIDRAEIKRAICRNLPTATGREAGHIYLLIIHTAREERVSTRDVLNETTSRAWRSMLRNERARARAGWCG